MSRAARLAKLAARTLDDGDYESGIVLADALEETGHVALAERLRRALAHPSFLLPRRTGPGWIDLQARIQTTLERMAENERTALHRLALSAARLRGRARHEVLLRLADELDALGWRAGRVATGRSGPPQIWRIQSLDVWGNRREGYEINRTFNEGEIRLPSREYLYNAQSYARNYRDGYRSDTSGHPLIRLVFTDGAADEGALERAVRQRFLAPGARVTFNNTGDGFIEVARRPDGMPVLHLHLGHVEPDS